MTRVVVTGAAGFLGRAIVQRALIHPQVSHVTASDLAPFGSKHPKLHDLPGDLSSATLRHAVGLADIVIHLAATLGGAAETDPDTAFAVNVIASLDLMRAASRGARFVFASSLAVLGDTRDQRAPHMIYGAHKAMVEIALETATRRGELDGISLRPGGIVARPGNGAGLKSAFLSQLFWAMRDGRDMVMPVSETGRTNISSLRNVADNFLHAALAPSLGPNRSLTLPMLCAGFDDLVAGLRAAHPASPAQISFVPDAQLDLLFGRANLPDFDAALGAGFAPDASLAALIADALTAGDAP